MTPTQRTLRHLRDSGAAAQVVEYWHHHARRRMDLCGCIDIIAARPGVPAAVLIQCTSGAHHAHREAKIAGILADRESADGAILRALVGGGASIEVWSWSRRGPRGRRKRWQPRVSFVRTQDATPRPG